MAAAFLAISDIPLLVVRGLEFAPYFLAPLDTLVLPPGKGCFTCCQRGHVINGVPIKCDKLKIGSVVDQMLSAKVKHLFKRGRAAEARYTEALRAPLWLNGLPSAAAKWGNSDTETDEVALERLEYRLRLVRDDQNRCMPCGYIPILGPNASGSSSSSTSTSPPIGAEAVAWPLLCYAALAGDAAATRALLRQGADVNACVPVDYPLLCVPKGLTPLMCAAMLAPWNVVEVLLAAGANPHAVASGTGALAGGNALDFAALQGHEDNVRQWLTRFPKWDLERKGAMLGFTPLSFAVGAEPPRLLGPVTPRQQG
jgi:hypothetical protein